MHQGSSTNRFKGFKIDLFYMAYLLLILERVVIDSTNLSDLIPIQALNIISNGISIMIILLVLCVFMQINIFTLKEIAVIAACMIIFFISAYSSDSYLLFAGVLLILCSKNVDFDQLVHFSIRVLTVIFICIVTLSFLGFIQMGVMERSSTEITRYSAGFKHPNTLGMQGFQWVCQYIFIKRNIYNQSKYLLCGIITAIIYMITNSNTALLGMLLVLLTSFIYENVVIRGLRLPKQIVRIIVILLLIIAMIEIIYWLRYFWFNPDQLTQPTLRTRIILAARYINAYGIDWFGHNIVIGDFVTIPGYRQGYYYLDNAYVWLLVRYGILASIIIVIAYTIYYKNLIKEKEWVVLMISFFYLIYGLSETYPFRVEYNIFLIHMGTKLYKRKQNASNVSVPISKSVGLEEWKQSLENKKNQV